MNNLLLMTDSYKASHFLQYPPDTEYVSSYIESRGGKWTHTLFFGLQMFIKEYLTKPITQDMILEAAAFWELHGEPFHIAGWQHILAQHGGYLPVHIEAVPEGTLVPNKNVLVQITNTDPECYWLPSYLETALLRAVWYPSTVATNSYACKRVIFKALEKSSDDPEGQIGFKLHDFGARGVSSHESAGIGGAAHLVNFFGTDTVEGIMHVRKYYGNDMAGFSIPAAEHSTMTTWGGKAGEVDAMRNMLKQFAKPETMVAVVSDSYDIWHAVRELWGQELKQEVLDSGACIVIRPDSGDPETVPVGVVQDLWEAFGGTVNKKGYKVLNPAVRVIQGDGIDVRSIEVILTILLANGFSADNIAFGQGGGLLQKVDRDTLEFAMKASAIKMTGDTDWRDVYKDPVDQPMKRSKRGHLALSWGVGDHSAVISTVKKSDLRGRKNALETVFADGMQINSWSFEGIRIRANVRIDIEHAGD